MARFLLFINCIGVCVVTTAQTQPSAGKVADTSEYENTELRREVDLIDISKEYLSKNSVKRQESDEIKPGKLRISGVPAAGYTLQTGFAGVVTANAAFYTNSNANTSSLLTSFTYTVRNQIILPVQTNIWTKDNRYNIVIDWRYLKFPSYTFGLGQYSELADGYLIDYSTIHLHQSILKKIIPDMYAGIGYNYDYYWDISETNPPVNKVTDFQSYGLKSWESASGVTLNFLYDTRKNSINPEGGNFVNVIYRPNLVVFGNTATWRSMVIDMRKYVNFPAGSKNVLAVWNYDWFTVSGKPPYLMLPNTGSDAYSNTGRGYIQGRFRGSNMAYLETEYRFSISNNGLLGGVVFANAQSFTLEPGYKYQTISPGWGAGIRLKLNKYSRTNVALDYGFGTGGSGGVFVNLGEVF